MTAVVNGHEIHSRGSGQLPRSASYTCVPILHPSTAYARKPSTPITIKGSFSEDDLIASADDSNDVSPPESSGCTTPIEEMKVHTDSAQDLVAELHKSPKISISRYAPSSEDETSTPSLSDGTPSVDSVNLLPSPAAASGAASLTRVPSTPPARSAPAVTPAASAPAATTNRLQNSSLAKRLSRKLSYSPSTPSRSPSPSSRRGNNYDHEAAPCPPPIGSTPVPARRKTVLHRKRESVNTYESGPDKSSGGLLSRRSTLLRRKSSKQPPPPPKPTETSDPAVRASMEGPKSARPMPAMPPLPKSFSTDRLPFRTPLQNDRPMPMPRPVSGDKIASLGALSLPRKRDELWSVFRSLDADYTKYISSPHRALGLRLC